MIHKGKLAVDAVLEKIALGQGNVLKQEIFKNNIEIDINEHLKEALTSAVSNVKIQLLSIVAGKDGGKYILLFSSFKTYFLVQVNISSKPEKKWNENENISFPN